MRKGVAGVLLASLALGAAAWGLWQWQKDDFDYAAAFERPEQGDSAEPPGVILRVPELAGRTPQELEGRLGAPGRCEDSLYSRRCRYSHAGAQVLFIDGKADWFLVPFGDSGYPLVPEALAALGLPENIVAGKPTQSSKRELVWENLAGYREVRLVADNQGIVTHALIKVSAR